MEATQLEDKINKLEKNINLQRTHKEFCKSDK